jgi:hypothetical protein
MRTASTSMLVMLSPMIFSLVDFKHMHDDEKRKLRVHAVSKEKFLVQAVSSGHNFRIHEIDADSFR